VLVELGDVRRSRPTIAAEARNRVSSPSISTSRKITGRQHRMTANATAPATSPTARIEWVLPALLQKSLAELSQAVRWPAR
jgi:hypothetical protein